MTNSGPGTLQRRFFHEMVAKKEEDLPKNAVQFRRDSDKQQTKGRSEWTIKQTRVGGFSLVG
jgi:hypothetical protein